MPRRSWYFLISVSALLALGFTTARANRHHHSVNISGGHRQPATDCSDLRIRFDDRDAMVRSEERTLTKYEAAVLEVHPHRNGGVQVAGWDKETYAVTACKAASGSGEEAEEILSQIKMSIENGKVSTSGPGDDEEWTVYLLIRAPKSASIDMDTMNGPISLYDVDGKLTARAKNGPISLKNFSGDAEITAVNGPISLDGGRGSVRIHTENGPISVELQGKTWSGEGLSADAKNGPVTLMVPSGYQSSFVVESTNYAPVSCKASICDNARKTWDDEHRRIEYGNAPAMIRLSTVNGPVTVRDSRENL
ncbi:MAG: hypothetical protein AUG46_04465 [Acidobacteria bacterium 13_1_20CM_3_58_11]|nr:MAG: hypothetical protein AUG46_04465 [Acidobacteria bacterium 13_1_20CM_3_58_11]